MRCSVQGCPNDTKYTSKSHGITFHMFPKDPELRAEWVEGLGMEGWELKERSIICSKHFYDDDFYETYGGRRKIRCGAIPFVIQDSADDLGAPAAQRVCRICLAMDTKMYDMRDYNMDQMYEQITGVLVSEEDGLPQKLCWECAHRLSACIKIRDKAIHAQTIMMEMLQPGEYITVGDIKSVNRTHNQLKSNLIHKIYETDDYDVHIQDSELVKLESGNYNDDEEEQEEYKETDNTHIIVEVKDEDAEFIDSFEDTDDDNKFNEIHLESKANIVKEEKYDSPSTKIDKIQRRDRGLYRESMNDTDDDKKIYEIPVKPKLRILKKQEDDIESTAMDKDKRTGVKRRKIPSDLNESLFTITKLTYDEQIAEIKKRQESSMYKNITYKCALCYKGFWKMRSYDRHMLRHSEQSGAYECFICKTRLMTSRALKKHLTAQHTEKFSCKKCAFVTNNREIAKGHEKWHTGTIYKCPHCPSLFDKSTTYKNHLRMKHVSDFVCELCGYTFVNNYGIQVHKRIKHRRFDSVPADGPYCEVCDVRFLSDEAFSRHLKLSSRHINDNDSSFFRNDSKSMDDSVNKSPEKKMQPSSAASSQDPEEKEKASELLACEQCGLHLLNPRLYTMHFRRAHPDKNRTKFLSRTASCMCEQCGRIFQCMALLQDHMWTHTGEKKFKCERCPKSFAQKSKLVFHMRVHRPHRPSYECPLCGKHFTQPENRRRHMLIHAGVRPYKCDTCGKCFTTSTEMRVHVEHVHLKKPWPKRVRSRSKPVKKSRKDDSKNKDELEVNYETD